MRDFVPVKMDILSIFCFVLLLLDQRNQALTIRQVMQVFPKYCMLYNVPGS